MTLIQFMERHRTVEFGGVALNGELSEQPCDCCGSTEKSERYAFEVDSGQERLLCPSCASAIGRVLHPENFDKLHSYHVLPVRWAKDEADAKAGGGNLLVCAEDQAEFWGVYGKEYDTDLVQFVTDSRTKQEAEAWAAYLGGQDHLDRLSMLQPFIDDGRIFQQKTKPDGTLEFWLNMDDPRKSADLIVHPHGAPLDYNPGPPFYVKTTLYRDKDWHEMVGVDIEDITDEESLVLWLKENTEPADPSEPLT